MTALAAARRLARTVLAAPPVYPVLRRRAHRGDPVAILCYHTLGPDDEVFDAWTVLRVADFRAQIAALRADFDIVSLDEALDRPRAAGARPRAVVTFDDGDAGLRRHLLPVLDAEQIPVTVYVATAQIETGRPYWFDRIMNALQAPGPVRIDLRPAGLGAWTLGPGRGAARWEIISDILETLKGVDPGRRGDLADAIVAEAPPAGGFTPLAPLALAELAELAESPWVTIGAHSHCHSLLDQIPEQAVRDSAARSRALLQGWTGRPVEHFAYPNGNHSPAVRAVIGDLGFRSAVVLDGRLWQCGPGGAGPQDRLALPRLPVGRYDALARFRLRLVGI